MVETVFDRIHQFGHADTDQAEQGAQGNIERQRTATRGGHRRHGENRLRSDHRIADRRCRGAGHGHRNQRARAQFEQQQLHGQNNGRHGRTEYRSHASGGAGGEQGLALDCGHVQQLADQRTERTAGGDDRAFRAERAAGADGNRRGHRFQEGNAWCDLALIQQYLFHRFGNAVTADCCRSPARHRADDQATDGRNHDDPQAKMVFSG